MMHREEAEEAFAVCAEAQWYKELHQKYGLDLLITGLGTGQVTAWHSQLASGGQT